MFPGGLNALFDPEGNFILLETPRKGDLLLSFNVVIHPDCKTFRSLL